MSVPYLDFLSGLLIVDLVHRLVYLTALFVPVYALCRWLGRRLPYLQMTLWTLVFIRAVLPVDFSLPFSLREWAAVVAPDLFGFVEFRLRLHGWGYAVASPTVAEWFPYLTWQMALVGLWLGVAAALLMRLAVSRRCYWLLVRRSEPVADARVLALVTQWRACLRIRRRVTVLTSDTAVSPFTIGILRPRVYLPRSLLDGAPLAQIDAVLGHELAHVRRFDDLWVQAQAVVLALLFFFPPLRHASRQLTQQREVVCDQIAVTRGRLSAKTYGHSLLQVLTSTIGRRRQSAMAGLVGDAAFCSMRIAAIGDAARSGLRGVLPSGLLALIILVFLIPLGPHGDPPSVQERQMLDRTERLVTGPVPLFLSPIAGATPGDGFRAVPRSQRVSYRYHTGLDLIAPVGSPVNAMAPGVVDRVRVTARDSLSARTGGYVSVRHGDYLVYYTYLRDIRVEPGDNVDAGDVLGTLGPVPFSPEGKPPHLHLEVLRAGVSVDPAVLLGLRPLVAAAGDVGFHAAADVGLE
jgi:bla regulator protein blaR1